MSPLDHALALAARGLSVIPVPMPDAQHDGKRPVIAWREYQSRRASEDEIREWFRRPQNIAVITGAISGVVVVDVDSVDDRRWIIQRLPWTPWQTRTSRGWHLWYQHPGILVRNRARLDTGHGRAAIDIRGDGGFVIAPGSKHASGHVYAYAGDWTRPRATLPRFWPGWLERPRRSSSPRPSSPRSSGPVVERARKYLDKIPVPQIGCGSDSQTLYAACRVLRGFGLSEADTTDLLWDWAGGRPGWTREWIARKVSNAAKYGTEPIGGLA